MNKFIHKSYTYRWEICKNYWFSQVRCVDDNDIELVIGQTGVSQKLALAGIVENNGDIVNAIMALTDLDPPPVPWDDKFFEHQPPSSEYNTIMNTWNFKKPKKNKPAYLRLSWWHHSVSPRSQMVAKEKIETLSVVIENIMNNADTTRVCVIEFPITGSPSTRTILLPDLNSESLSWNHIRNPGEHATNNELYMISLDNNHTLICNADNDIPPPEQTLPPNESLRNIQSNITAYGTVWLYTFNYNEDTGVETIRDSNLTVDQAVWYLTFFNWQSNPDHGTFAYESLTVKQLDERKHEIQQFQAATGIQFSQYE